MSDRIDVFITGNRLRDVTMAPILNITDMVTEPFTFSMTAQGGFATAQVTITTDELTASQFLDDHIGQRLLFTNPMVWNKDQIAWEGQIQTVTVDDGRTAITRTMRDVFNEVWINHTEAILIGSTYYEGGPLSSGTTSGIPDATSSNRYGLRTLYQNAGVLTAAAATDYADRLLNDYKNPKTTVSGTTLGSAPEGGQVVVRIEAAGWYEQYNAGFYTSSNTSTVSTHTILAIIAPLGTSFDDGDTSNIQSVGAPGWLRTQPETITIADYIGTLTAGGSSSNTRCYFGLYEHARPYFHAEASSVRYYVSCKDQSERVYDSTQGRFVPPWDIRPGFPCEITDFLQSASRSYSTWQENPRVFVIGAVEFTAPNTVTLRPVDVDAGSLTLSRMEWYSNMMPYLYMRLDGPPTPWQPPVPGGGAPPPWWNDDPTLPIPLDPGQTPPGWRQPYVGVPDPSQILPPLPPGQGGPQPPVSGTLPQP